MSPKEPPRIAIIGAGIAGLAAARTLYKNGFDQIRIFEASTRIGGRINTVQLDDGYIEMGAQWIHGQEDNVLYDYAAEKDLVADPFEDFGVEGTGSFCLDDGTLANCYILEELIAFLDASKEMEDDHDSSQSMFDYFKKQFDHFVASKANLSKEAIVLLQSVFRWFIIFEVIDNSCDNLCQLSPLSYTEWEECDGVVDLINLKRGYASVVKHLCQEFPLDSILQLQTAVVKIEPAKFENSQIKVKLHTVKLSHDVEKCYKEVLDQMPQEEHIFDHVIVTSSIGFLKDQLKTDFFAFALPVEKAKVISALGFGTINKVFLYFDQPFWFDHEKGFQILWQGVHDEHSYPTDQSKNLNGTQLNKLPSWVHCIQSFDPVRGQPNMLMAWIGSYGAKQMESFTDEEIGNICGEVLRQVVPESRRASPIVNPSKVYASRWHSHPFIRGSYSNRTIEYQNLKLGAEYNIDVLAKPIRVRDLVRENEDSRPLILFAGEATDRVHYSTTDGAFRSGVREATSLIDFYHCQPLRVSSS